ncbi:hypothetical protein [Chryseobacterium taklimakanense]|uniref:hypothetical protein n=1 Tax=Chryseobacterium taklimakanense TaxID=536441 RepID=UPI00161EA2D9|nr:hypothetical protein [Chryseobacterium taklimakanense]
MLDEKSRCIFENIEFVRGKIGVGFIVAGLNHAMHEIGNDSPFDDGGGKSKANVYIETDGVGHVYVEIDGTVYSYGRYNGSYSPSSGKFGPYGDGVLLRLDGENATNFIAERTAKYPTSTYSVNVDGAKVKAYYNKLYNSGKPLQGKDGFYKYGRVVDTYSLMGPGGNNCSTIIWNSQHNNLIFNQCNYNFNSYNTGSDYWVYCPPNFDHI